MKLCFLLDLVVCATLSKRMSQHDLVTMTVSHWCLFWQIVSGHLLRLYVSLDSEPRSDRDLPACQYICRVIDEGKMWRIDLERYTSFSEGNSDFLTQIKTINYFNGTLDAATTVDI